MSEFEKQVTRKQHLISKALLHRFARPDGNLRSLDLKYGRVFLRNPSAVGWRWDFVTHLPNQAEQLWETVETGLAAALDGVENDSLTAIQESVLKQAIALHFFRRDATKLAFEQSIVRSIAHRGQKPREGHLTAPRLAKLSALANESSAEWFQDAIEDLFRRGTAEVLSAQLEIVTAVEGEFLIGDRAILSLSSDSGFGTLPFTDAATHLLPVGRRHAIALAPEGGAVQVEQTWVDQLNTAQIREASSHVFFHPDSGLDDFVTAARLEILREKDLGDS